MKFIFRFLIFLYFKLKNIIPTEPADQSVLNINLNPPEESLEDIKSIQTHNNSKVD
jgi:hypothetical protein